MMRRLGWYACTRAFSRRQRSRGLEAKIREHTEISRDHLTPEIGLHLITERCDQWHATEDRLAFCDPFWAFYWPGGQALTRYVLDEGLCAGKSVVDVGSGCGASAVGAAMTGARRTVANDIDTMALTAIAMNCALNDVCVETSSADLIGSVDAAWDVLLIGDMFYDAAITDRILSWLERISNANRRILLGEPGRPYFDQAARARFTKVAEYDLPRSCRLGNSGLTAAGVYEWNDT